MIVGMSGQKVRRLKEKYFVECILDKQVIKGQTKYLIKWEGYDDESQYTYEPRSNLQNVLPLLKQFDDQFALDNPTTKFIKKRGRKPKNKQNESKKLQEKPQIQKTKNQNTNQFQPILNEVEKLLMEQNSLNVKFQQQFQKYEEIKNQEDNEPEAQENNLPVNEIMEMGSLDKGDICNKVLSMEEDQGKRLFMVEWRAREGRILEPTLVESDVLKVCFPQKILDYYQTQIDYEKIL